MGIVVDPTWYFYSMHFTAILTTPINLIGKTSGQTDFDFQICSMTTDFFINIGTLPVVYSPFPIGRPHGIFTRIFQFFGISLSTEAQCIMVFVSIFITAGSVELLFFLRYQAILPHSHPYKLTTFTSVVLVSLYQIVLITIMIISFHSAVPDQKVARAQFASLYPEYQYLVIDEHVYFVCVIVELVHIIFLFSCFFRLGLGMITVILLIWMSSRSLHRFDLSTKTRMMHMQLIRSLCYQISVPILAFYGPVFVVIAPLMFTIPNTQKTIETLLLSIAGILLLAFILVMLFHINCAQELELLFSGTPVAIQAEENANKELEILDVPAADHRIDSDSNVVLY
ncbi:hypothetical protein CRE_27876 [Caenorhabditis remanei]|uniref:G protein-coupled receptor n=1 Tax=Caenorhabditis remanei TaxID=31234 RepID=E3NG92_CAERE|nr:hypothetical protein CRE_27876 [Caenorhabditis remanei]